jgi:hypothetical protein
MSMNDEDRPYAGITEDVEYSAWSVWQKVCESAQEQNRPEERVGAAGYLWTGALVHVIEELWPELGGDARATKAVNYVRVTLHTFLTRRGLMHCDKRGGGSGPASVWWVRADWAPQPGSDRHRYAPAGAEVEAAQTPEADRAQEPTVGMDESLRLHQILTLILTAQEVGAPLTTTALSQIPVGVPMAERHRLLAKLIECGAVEVAEMHVPSGHWVAVYIGAEDSDFQALSPSHPQAADIDPAELMSAFLEQHRQLQEDIAAETRRAEEAEKRLARIGQALGY